MKISSTRVYIAIFAFAAFLCLGPAAQAGTAKWEYLVVTAALQNRNLERVLNERGAEGWELVAFTNKDVAVFKRPAR